MSTKGIAGIRLGPNSTAAYGYLYGGHATASEFSQVNPVLELGWIGYESDTGRAKIGDGTSDWNTLEYSFYPLNSDRRSTTGIDTTDDLIVDSITKGLVLKNDADGHYYRLTMVAGSATWTDLGATKP